MKRGTSFWDFLAWLVLFAIFFWFVLKSSGIIAPSGWENYGIFVGAIYVVGRAMHKLDVMYHEVKDLRRFKFETINEIKTIKINSSNSVGKN